ncbi:hypothetical protein ILUMI_09931 [Ignelater luminosus]|uniref:HTH psq-type domain-containing protein n=1 Tax=Ignelater luminosus TaxID=2038154 RepID=A0A8K0CZ24_IGNLU|nr:hypothetical protein ILUMI_09931 [Ignelater luminosus]
MMRTYEKKSNRRLWPKNALIAAFYVVEEEGIIENHASDVYQIPEPTLRRYVTKHQQLNTAQEWKNIEKKIHQTCDSYLINNQGKTITDKQIVRLFAQAFLKSAIVDVAVKSFEKCEIEPFKPGVFDDADFVPAMVSERDDEPLSNLLTKQDELKPSCKQDSAIEEPSELQTISEKPLKVVNRGIPAEINTTDIKNDLEETGFQINFLIRITVEKEKLPTPLVHVSIKKTPEAGACPKFSKKLTPENKLEPAIKNQRPTQEISSPSPPPLTKSFAEVVANPSAQIHTTPQRKQSSEEDSSPLLNRMLGNAANTRHPGTLMKLLAIAIDVLSNKDIT